MEPDLTATVRSASNRSSAKETLKMLFVNLRPNLQCAPRLISWLAFALVLTAAYPAHAGYAHFWAGNPSSTTPYVAGAPYTYNSSGGANRIERTATGRYSVTLEGVNDSTRGGNVQVAT